MIQVLIRIIIFYIQEDTKNNINIRYNREFTKHYIVLSSFLLKILSFTQGNVTEAARISGRFRSDIYRLMEKYGINKGNYTTLG